jgi:hypothetical protein
MTQEPLFFEDIYEAIRTDVMAMGGFKRVGAMLWPEKMADKAGEHLNNCLNRTRQEKLDPEQVLFIKREAKKRGSYATLFYEADDVGMTRGQPIEPEDERAKLQRQFIESTRLLEQMVGRMQSLSK